jgi:predicted glycosyltransferase
MAAGELCIEVRFDETASEKNSMSRNTPVLSNHAETETSPTKRTTSLDLGPKSTSRLERKKIWIDLDNSPHVPFFLPIIDELRARGLEVILTARDSYQVCELLEFHKLSCDVVGRHWGKHRTLKMLGTCLRAMQLVPMMMKKKPDLAVSHGSRSQFLSSVALGIPNLTILDYEFTAKMGFLRPDWVFLPNYIPDSPGLQANKAVMKYPGLKEDVYVPRLRPDTGIKEELGIGPNDLVVTVRPPATEAHYHNPEAEVLLTAALKLLVERPEVRVILLPRNDRQAKALRKSWGDWIAKRKIVIPERVVDGLNLIWFSDFVISGGGTMNREAAALGIPVYSIFRGRIGAVDQDLASSGRLVLIETVDDVQNKVLIQRREQRPENFVGHRDALDTIVNGIVSIAEQQCLPGRP